MAMTTSNSTRVNARRVNACRERSFRALVMNANLHIPERDRAVVALNHDRPLRELRVLPAIAGRRLQLRVVLHDLPIEDRFRQPGVRDLLAVLVEARGEEGD